MNLTTTVNQAYPSHTTAKSVVGMAVLVKAAIGRKVFSNAAFLLSQCAHSLWVGWAGAARPPVRFSGTATCSVPPTRWQSGSGSFNELKSEHIMTNTSLVPVFTGTISNQSIQICNARDLHAYLDVGDRFDQWISRRISEYGFIDGEDYCTKLCIRSDGKAGRGRTEYHLTLDMAKELAMVENNDKGRQIRRYFISLERKPVVDHSAQLEEIQKAFEKQYQKLRKRYDYPRKLLEQSGFVSADGKHPARLNMSMLTNTKAFISPLMHLLNEMRMDGHDVSAPWDEFIAMREALIAADKALEMIYTEALQVNFRSASTALKGGNK